jgi:cytochrome b6-f complex iron-sulfur subunit
MTPRSYGQFRSFLFLAVALTSPATALADTDLSGPASFVTAIITLGVVAFGVLALYVLYLTGRFLWAAFQEATKARKEAAAHATPHGKEEGRGILSAAFGLNAFFAILSVGFLFVAFLIVTSGMDPLITKYLTSLLINFGVASFALLSLYIVLLGASALWKKFRPVKATPVEGLEGIPVTRRSFLSLLGWAWVVFTAATMGALTTVLRFFFPNVTFEPPLKFAAGFPDTYNFSQTGVVDERFKDAHRCWIVRTTEGFYALSTICTHLGCTPNWLQAEQKFKCPCHGSGYYITGVNFEGPAPRPLPRFNITLADDGQIQVDESIEYQQELGQWGLPGSFLDYKA